MLKVKVYTYNPKYQIHKFDVFVLSRGLNSGKPLEKPCPNCFVVSCKKEEEKEFYTSLILGLWKINRFRPLLVGSVIPFLRISDFKNYLEEQAEKISFKPEDFKADVKKVKIIEAKQKQILEQTQLLNELKYSLIIRHFKNKR